MSSLRSPSVFCHIAGYVVLALCHCREPAMLGYSLLLAGIVLSLFWRGRK